MKEKRIHAWTLLLRISKQLLDEIRKCFATENTVGLVEEGFWCRRWRSRRHQNQGMCVWVFVGVCVCLCVAVEVLWCRQLRSVRRLNQGVCVCVCVCACVVKEGSRVATGALKDI